MLFPRAIRLDNSDESAFERSAEPGEWAVPGSFEYYDTAIQQLTGKAAQAFAHGFLGVPSFGRTTLVEVAEISSQERSEVVRRLAQRFVDDFGAPHISAALPAAEEEAAFAESICEHPVHTLLMIERELTRDGIHERFKVVAPRSAAGHEDLRIWGPADDAEAGH